MNPNYSDVRASKARLGARISPVVQRCIMALAGLMAVGGTLLGVGVDSVGWLLLGLAAVPFVGAAWVKGELRDILVDRTSSTVDARLNGHILAKLSKNPTPSDIASAASTTNDGLFYAARFGLTPNFLTQISSSEPSDAATIWKDAMELRERQGAAELGAGQLIYALVKQIPEHQALLAHNHIELEDIIKGIEWQDGLKRAIAHHKQPKRTGGIARDWSFGYTPLLQRFGQNISQQVAGGTLTVDLDAHDAVIERLIDTFSGKGRQNAVLVGATGVGKTTIIHSFAERLLDASSSIPSNLKFRQVVLLDSAAIISAAPGRGEVEGLIMRILGEAYAAKNIIVCLDDAQLFFEDGVGSVDISNVLLPIIEAGRLRMMLTMDEQRFLQISQRNSALVNATNRVVIEAASKDETVTVMQNQLLLYEFGRSVTYTYQAVEESYRLSERYVHDLAMPGRALKLLEASADFAENGLVTINSVQHAIEQTVGVKVSVASDAADRDVLLNLEQHIHKRMINQSRAVTVVSDAIRRARAGVRNQDRPIGTFLFLGPTGVGKTELSKALAEVYFGGENRLVRVDLNEYVLAEDVNRLIADGAQDPSSLTAQIMKQPFSVVLLDEIEKAHPAVLTTLLQLLDEGILRDFRNREVSFRDAIIIATSNAGADRIREYVERGYDIEQFEQKFIDELVDTGQFRPEFLNRFDEIVTFRPLNKQELLQVVDLIIKGVNKTLAVQKIKVDVTDEARRALVEKGYDPRLGARPMRRVIQRIVENNVAKAILAGMAKPGTTVTINANEVNESAARNDRADAIRDEASGD